MRSIVLFLVMCMVVASAGEAAPPDKQPMKIGIIAAELRKALGPSKP
jgi:hypothetical protein